MCCRHCGRYRVTRPRGLCWTCFRSPAIRSSYPTKPSKYAYRGGADFRGTAPLAARPTAALPGTPEKLAVLEQRASRLEALWHPADALYLHQHQLA